MTSRRCVLASAVLLAVLGASEKVSGQGEVRSGFWLEASKGTGTVRNTCAGCAGVTVAYGPTYHLRAGGALNPRVLVGLELFSHRAPGLRLAPGEAPLDAENVSVSPIVIWYVGQSGFFLKGGAGLAQGTFAVRPESSEPIVTERLGTGLTFGIGLDLKLAGWLALTANVGTYVTAIGDVQVEETLVDDIIATVYEAAIGIALR